MPASRLTPVTGSERLDQLDILRGFALFGILLVNFEFFLSPIQSVVLGAASGVDNSDAAVGWGIKALAEGKFYALFSMLFGAGFTLMAERAIERGKTFWPLYLRRLLILLGIGLVHLLLIWSGDILVVYAVVAFLMVLLFRKTPVRRLPKWAVVFLLVPALIIIGLSALLSVGPPEVINETDQQFNEALEQARSTADKAATIYASGSFAEATVQRLDDMGFLFMNFLFWVPPILGYFLLGRWLIATQRLTRPNFHVRFYRGALLLGFLVGLPLCLASTWMIWNQNLIVITPQLALAYLCLAIGAPLMAFGYLALVITNRHRLAWLAPAGRMALTHYLTQSLFWTWMIYGYGLGLGPDIPYWSTPILALVFFTLQIVASHWWLNRFRFGPAEWVWRSLTYLHLQPMRKSIG